MHQQGAYQTGMARQDMYQQGMYQQRMYEQGMYQQPDMAQQHMYQQAQFYGAVQTQAPTTKEDRKQIKKHEKDDERRKRLERVRERQEKQRAKDDKNFLLWMSGVLVLFGILLGLLLIGDSWSSKKITGTGIGMLTMRTSLLYLTIDLDCRKSFYLETLTCKQLLGAQGVHSFLDASGATCAVPFIGSSMCSVMTQAYHVSFVILGSFTIAVLCNFFAAFFLWQYYQLHHPHLRKWASSLTAASTGIACLGLFLWTLTMPDLADIPRAITSGSAALTGGLVGSRELNGFQFGWTWFAACFVCLLMLVQCVLWYCFFMPKDDEEEILFNEELQKDYIASLEAHGYADEDYQY
eukprot:TRINITY_DN6252_c0_g1_i3.p1 TRINITY_DN6252_c0_g1~~TRINITY_DN6252_c0_g1_i3.p1  ORF type:complete len:351 (+),score=75.19 TRINITY_DN6252_c0_g1_i3:128-1180(+)